MNKKAVVMISGGLDSTLAARILLEQGVELCGIYLSAPWGCCDKTKAMKVARMLGIDFMVVKMEDEYIRLIRAPKYGYGSSMNPCIDCRIYMFQKAKGLMEEIGASFLVTGEVLGQRPMSQMRPSLRLIEEQAGLNRRVVRPLSAKVMPVTLPEEQGLIDRNQMYGITGRSRKTQMELARRFGILDFPNPAGGCLLTDRQFGNRVRDLFDHQEEIDLEDMELLRVGRHFRLDDRTKLIVGRNEEENATLEEYLAPARLLFKPIGFGAPSVLTIGPPSEKTQELAIRLITHYAGKEKLAPQSRITCTIGRPREMGSLERPSESFPIENLEKLEEELLAKLRV